MNIDFEQPIFVGDCATVCPLFALPLPDPLKELVFEYRYGFRLASLKECMKWDRTEKENVTDIQHPYDVTIRKVGILAQVFKRSLFINYYILKQAQYPVDETFSLDKNQILAFLNFQNQFFILCDDEMCNQEDWLYQKMRVAGDKTKTETVALLVKNALEDMNDKESSKWDPDFWMCAMIKATRMCEAQTIKR